MVLDNGSVFTQQIVVTLEEKKVNFEILDPISIAKNNLARYTSFILSGRRKNDKTMNTVNSEIIKHAVSNKKPLLGICYGAEILVLTLGGTIKKMPSLHKGLENISLNQDSPLCQREIEVYESHSYEIAKLPPEMKTLGSSNKCNNEIIQLKNSKIYGVQFHPEMTDDGKTIIHNFLNL